MRLKPIAISIVFSLFSSMALAQPDSAGADGEGSEYLPVDVQYLGEKTLQVQDRVVPAEHYRLSTGERDIELWYSGERDWLGLSSSARGGRELHYRRVPIPVEIGSDSVE